MTQLGVLEIYSLLHIHNYEQTDSFPTDQNHLQSIYTHNLSIIRIGLPDFNWWPQLYNLKSPKTINHQPRTIISNLFVYKILSKYGLAVIINYQFKYHIYTFQVTFSRTYIYNKNIKSHKKIQIRPQSYKYN